MIIGTAIQYFYIIFPPSKQSKYIEEFLAIVDGMLSAVKCKFSKDLSLAFL